MKILIPKIVRALPLADYAPEYGEAVMQVWVNPQMKLFEQMQDFLKESASILAMLEGKDTSETKKAELRERFEALNTGAEEVLSAFWSQGAAETRMTPEDVSTLANESKENDPALFRWLVARTWYMILEYRAGIKKN
jgi:hypothetical protein